MNQYNVVWNEVSKDETGQMPIGNGDIAAGVYVLGDGTVNLLLSKSDAFNYQGDLLKTGLVKIRINPNPFTDDVEFTQELDFETGSIKIKTKSIQIDVWADANHPTYHIDIKGDKKYEVTVKSEAIKRYDGCSYNYGVRKPSQETVQDIFINDKDAIIWCYHVGNHSVYSEDLDYYDVEDTRDCIEDPFKYNTFGNLIESDALRLENGQLVGTQTEMKVKIHSHCGKHKAVTDWLEEIKAIAKASPKDYEKAWYDHQTWWNDFWCRSKIQIQDNRLNNDKRGLITSQVVDNKRVSGDSGAIISQSYYFFRYMMASQSRGSYQVKFNGGLFTQPLKVSHDNELNEKKDLG